MSTALQISHIHPIHPFPARMAPSIVWSSLPSNGKPLLILDPMVGSGTSLVIARARGHYAIGCDTDPLAVNIAYSWCSDFQSERLLDAARSVLTNAIEMAKDLVIEGAYPSFADEETKEFIKFWFDENNRIQLTALSHSISAVENPIDKNILFTALSRLIITKQMGVSLAMDVSHSRPHRKYEIAPVTPFDKFLSSVNYIIKKALFRDGNFQAPPPIVTKGDARSLAIGDNSVDIVITSPPYLNAIDYLRGHKLSLVWMGYTISSLRSVRSNNIGSELTETRSTNGELLKVFQKMGDIDNLSKRDSSMIMRYLNDTSNTLKECRRVLKKNGKAIFVIGNSAIRGIQISNSEALINLAYESGFELVSELSRAIPESRRYLPPPNSKKANEKLQNRMREEVVLQFFAM